MNISNNLLHKQDKLKQSLSLILPVYNEKDLVTSALNRCLESLFKDFSDFEIILLDDGSNDGTGEIMDELSKDIKQIRVFHNYINLNLGISMQRGFAVANKDYVIFDSVDLPLDPKDIRGFIENNLDSDMLVLERISYPGATLWRKFTSLINCLLLRILFPIVTRGFKDLNFTFIYKRQIFKLIQPLAKSPAFTQPEMILRAKYQKLRIKSIPICYHARHSGKGAFGKPHDIIWTLYDMFRFRVKTLLRRFKWKKEN